MRRARPRPDPTPFKSGWPNYGAQRDDAEADRRSIADRAREKSDPRLLGLLPTGALRDDLPDAVLRDLLDLLRLRISYDRSSRHVTYD